MGSGRRRQPAVLGWGRDTTAATFLGVDLVATTILLLTGPHFWISLENNTIRTKRWFNAAKNMC